MTDWGAHHFGGATFACDVRELQPDEVIYHDDKEGTSPSRYEYPNGFVAVRTTSPARGNMQIEGTPGEKRSRSRCRPTRGNGGIYGDFIECVKTREKPFRDIELAVNTAVGLPPGQHRLPAEAVAQMGCGSAGNSRRRRSQPLARSCPPRTVAVVMRKSRPDATTIALPLQLNDARQGHRDMLADAFEALKKYDWGTDHGRARADRRRGRRPSRQCERRARKSKANLLAALKGELFARCPRLRLPQVDDRRHGGIGADVGGIARRTSDRRTWRVMRWSGSTPRRRERPCATPSKQLSGKLKIGVITSLGTRRDGEAVAALAGLLGDSDRGVSRAAALALGTIGTSEAAAALQKARQSGIGDKQAVIDGLLNCAESMLHDGKRANAQAIYESMSGEGNQRLIRLAATRRPLGLRGPERIDKRPAY